MLCMSSHARSVPEASVHPTVQLSIAACLVMRSSDSYHSSESKLRASNAFILNSMCFDSFELLLGNHYKLLSHKFNGFRKFQICSNH